MASNAMSGIGTGISLSGSGNMFQGLIARRQASEDARAKAEADRAAGKGVKPISWKEMSVPMKDLYPIYARQHAQVGADVVNDFQRYKAEGLNDDSAKSMVMMNMPAKSEKYNNISSYNGQAGRYLKPEKGLYVNPLIRDQLAKDVNNTELTAEEFKQKYNKPELGIYATDDYGFSFDPVPDLDLAKLSRDYVDKNNLLTIDPNAKPVRIPIPGSNGKFQYEQKMIADPAAADQIAQQLLSSDEGKRLYEVKYRPQLSKEERNPYYDDPNISPQDQAAAQVDEVANFVSKLLPSSVRVKDYAPIQETQAEKNKTWERSGNTLKNEKNVWHYDVSPSGDETYTFSKTNPNENFVMDFKSGDKVVKGTPIRMEIKSGKKTPDLFVVESQKVVDPNDPEKQITKQVEVKVPYTEYNASKIENEFGQNPYQVRKIITGGLERPEGAMTGSTKGKSAEVKSTSSSKGASSWSKYKIKVQ